MMSRTVDNKLTPHDDAEFYCQHHEQVKGNNKGNRYKA
jgi:hypothetical protein